MGNNPIRVLVSAAGTLASVSYINHLKCKGYYVIGINCETDTIGRYVCDEYHVSPMVNDAARFISFISLIDFDVYLPWLDEEHILFASKPEIHFRNKILTSPPQSIFICVDKEKTFEFAIKHKINVADKTKTVSAFVRKRFSRGSKWAREVSDQDELNKLDKNDYIIQNVLEGQEFTVDCLCNQYGIPQVIVPRERVSVANVSLIGRVNMDQDIISFCKVLLSKIKLTGPINIQVIKSNGKLFLVEINPRLAGTSILTIKAGVDILVDGIKAFLGQRIKHTYNIKDGLMMYRYYDEIYK